jgi:hypothetical protein
MACSADRRSDPTPIYSEPLHDTHGGAFRRRALHERGGLGARPPDFGHSGDLRTDCPRGPRKRGAGLRRDCDVPARRGAAPLVADVWMYGVVPAAIYLGLCAASVAIGARAEWAPRGLAALLLILLLVGIRNAWDLVTWIAPMRKVDTT